MIAAQKSDRRPVLVVISQVFVPDPAAVGQHIADVAYAMAREGWDVLVFTSDRGYDDPAVRYPRADIRGGVRIVRLRWSSFGKASLGRRLLAGAIFLLQATLRTLLLGRLDQVLVSTSPPFAGLGGAAVTLLRRVPMTWWVMDLNPDQLIASGRISARSLPARCFDWVNRLTLATAANVIVLDRFMQARVERKAPCGSKTHVCSPWSHDATTALGPDAALDFRRQEGLLTSFVVMYSGNHALQHPLTTLLDAASQLQHRPEIRFVFIGGGAGKKAVDAAIAAGATNIMSLPYQPLDRLGATLPAADCHVVSMGDDMVGIIHPCKVYSALAVGKPILFFGPPESHVGELLEAHRVGLRVDHGDTRGAIAAITSLVDGPVDARWAMGKRAAALAASKYSQQVSVERVCAILRDCDLRPQAHRESRQNNHTEQPATPVSECISRLG